MSFTPFIMFMRVPHYRSIFFTLKVYGIIAFACLVYLHENPALKPPLFSGIISLPPPSPSPSPSPTRSPTRSPTSSTAVPVLLAFEGAMPSMLLLNLLASSFAIGRSTTDDTHSKMKGPNNFTPSGSTYANASLYRCCAISFQKLRSCRWLDRLTPSVTTCFKLPVTEGDAEREDVNGLAINAAPDLRIHKT
jgi:hypothetical protein